MAAGFRDLLQLLFWMFPGSDYSPLEYTEVIFWSGSVDSTPSAIGGAGSTPAFTGALDSTPVVEGTK